MKVASYNLTASNGKHIRRATKVILPDGTEIKFLDLLSNKEAIRQAQYQIEVRKKWGYDKR